MFEVKHESSILEAAFAQGVFSYSMSNVDAGVLQPIKKEYNIRVNIKNVEALVKTLYETVEADYSEERLVNIGKILYQQLIPKDLSELLSQKSLFLTIITKKQDIPWELLHDGKDFLGIRHVIGRCIVGCESLKPLGQKREGKPSCLLISNPSGDLPEAESESICLRNFLRERSIKCNYLSHYEVSVSEVFMQLNSSKYDFIHYNGHIAREPEGNEYAFVLSDSEYFSLNSISTLEGFGNPFVFINGCGGKIDLHDTYGGGYINEGVVVPFILAGARAVIGSSWKVSDRGARVFAEKVYQFVFNGETIGEAVSKARSETMKDSPADPTWAAFVLYGNPCLCFINSDEMPKLPGKLTRADFTDEGWKVLETACRSARRSGLVSSTHLFSALIKSDRNCITPLYDGTGISGTEFEEVLDFIIENSEKQSPEITGINYSRNTQKVIVNASLMASSDGTLIEHAHLLQALLDTPDAGIFKVVEQILTYLKKRSGLKSEEAGKLELFDTEGCLRRELLSEECINSLRLALHYAENTEGVTTMHMFMGLLSRNGSLLERAFTELGVSGAQLEVVLMELLGGKGDTDRVVRPYEKMEMGRFTQNCLTALIGAFARASSSGRLVTEHDLAVSLLSLECSTTELLKKYIIDPRFLLKYLENHRV